MNKLAEWLGLGSSEEKSAPVVPKDYIPESLEDFVGVIKRTPEEVLSGSQKKLLGRAMSFPDRKVEEVMLPREEMVFVKENEFLGPFTLDKLYKSGFSHFPVIDKDRHILGLLHTERLNNLKDREGMPAKKYMDKDVVYVRNDYLLTEAVAAMIRNDRDYLMVIDNFEHLVGVITMPMCWKAMLGFVPEDDFKQDDSSLAVAKRRFDK